MEKPCKRCYKDFETPFFTKKYCTWCVAIHIKEIAKRRKYKNPMKKEKRPLSDIDSTEESRIRMLNAMEVRAEYIANYFMETGVLLLW